MRGLCAANRPGGAVIPAWRNVTPAAGARYDDPMIPARWLTTAILGALIAFANAPQCAVFQVIEPWVRPATAAATTEAYMQLVSSDRTTLVGVRSSVASRVELATGQKRTAPPFAVALPAGTTVALAPGGTRIVLRQLVHPLKLGQHVPITLVLQHADGSEQQIEVEAEVRRRSASDDHRVPHRH